MRYSVVNSFSYLPCTFSEMQDQLTNIAYLLKRLGATEYEVSIAELFVEEDTSMARPRYRFCAETEILNPVKKYV